MPYTDIIAVALPMLPGIVLTIHYLRGNYLERRCRRQGAAIMICLGHTVKYRYSGLFEVGCTVCDASGWARIRGTEFRGYGDWDKPCRGQSKQCPK